MGITERIDAITGISPEYRGTILPPPKSVKIELTARCNFSCAFCARSQKLRDQKDMDYKLFTRLLSEMRGIGVEEIGLFYLGESFLLKWLPEAVMYAKRLGFPYVFLTTNGSLSTPAKMATCMELGLDSLKFSLNYADADQFVEIARVKRSLFDVMIENIKSAAFIRDEIEARTGHRCGLYASYIQYDGEQGEKMKDIVAELEPFLDEIYALPLYNQADLVGPEGEKRGWKMTAGNRGRIGALREPLPCWALFTEGHISWDGMLTGCCFSHTPDFDFGDLKKVDFMSAWNSERAQWFRKANLKKDVTGTPCEKCVAYA